MSPKRSALFEEALTLLLAVAAMALMTVAHPRAAHAGEIEDLFQACTRGFVKSESQQILDSCDRFIERYSTGEDSKALGYAYYRRGLAKDNLEQNASSVSDYRRAIELGAVSGYSGLGGAYLTGQGVPEDERYALELFRKGCGLGDEASCLWLWGLGEEIK